MIKVYHQFAGTPPCDQWYALALEDAGTVATAFASTEHRVFQYLLESLPYNKPFQIVDELTSRSNQILTTMKRIYAGERIVPSFKLEISHLSTYAKKVLNFLAKVPIGFVTTYKELAKVTNSSPRAVGRVMAINPFPLLVPCHRVIRTDFTLGGFGLDGLKTKWELLQREDKHYEEATTMEINGKVITLFPIKYVRVD